jgi:F420-0:gamma-glutamyl ligase
VGKISLTDFLLESVKDLSEESIVVISSKVVALCEGAVVSNPDGKVSKDDLVKQDAEYWLPHDFSDIGYGFAIKYGMLASNAGIDESNGDGSFVLWPRDPFKSANQIRAILRHKFGRQKIGVIISDSTCLPNRRGTIGVMIAWSGFEPLDDLREDQVDLFGRSFGATVMGVANGLTAAANVTMGEGTGTPRGIAIISEVDFVKFVEHDPTADEIKNVIMDKDQDIYAPFLKLAPWQAGGGGYPSDIENLSTGNLSVDT